MDFIGEIVSEPDAAGMSKDRWIELIGMHPNLAHVEPRESINPFTRKPMLVHATPDTARVIVDGREVGTMYWSLDEGNLINVFGEPTIVYQLAYAISELLGGQFKPHAE